MPVQIIINGENAAESLKELSTLAAGFGSPVQTASEVKQEETTKRQSRATKADAAKPVKSVPEVLEETETEEKGRSVDEL